MNVTNWDVAITIVLGGHVERAMHSNLCVRGITWTLHAGSDGPGTNHAEGYTLCCYGL